MSGIYENFLRAYHDKYHVTYESISRKIGRNPSTIQAWASLPLHKRNIFINYAVIGMWLETHNHHAYIAIAQELHAQYQKSLATKNG